MDQLKNEKMSEAQLTELNIELNTKHRRLKALQEEKKQLEETIISGDSERMVLTRAMQTKLDEQKSKISQYEAKLIELEQTSGKTQKDLEKNY